MLTNASYFTEVREYLFNHNTLVSVPTESNDSVDDIVESSYTNFYIAKRFGVVIDKGRDLANREMIGYLTRMYEGNIVNTYFYRSFPMSVRLSSKEQLLMDQILNYVKTYGLGMFTGDTHSFFEETIERTAMSDTDRVIKHFDIISLDEVDDVVRQYASDLTSSTRAINDTQYSFLMTAIHHFNFKALNCASKNLAIRILVDTRNLDYGRFLSLTDVLKVVEYMQTSDNKDVWGKGMKDLHITSAGRRFLTELIDMMFMLNPSKETVISCYERKKIWNGLLHCIHYVGKTDRSRNWVNSIRNNAKKSPMSRVNAYTNICDLASAVDVLTQYHGAGAVARNMNYLLSRANNEYSINAIIDGASVSNPIIAMQYVNSLNTDNTRARVFSFTKNGRVKHHTETAKEMRSRKSFISPEVRDAAVKRMMSNIDNHYRSVNVGKVFISPEMEKVALPMFNATAQGGVGVLPTGSRIAIGSNIVRAFIYWEKVNDIDLSCIGIHDDNTTTEFSWRRYHDSTSYITFSGDITDGYYGGSEFFDVNLEKLKNVYPSMKYLVFNANVYTSRVNFDQCFCKAGFMKRENADAGEVYEPKTVVTSFRINAEANMAKLFAIDLTTNEIVWLNLPYAEYSNIAGNSTFDELDKYLKFDFSYKYLFERIGTLVDDPSEADIIVSDTVSVDGKENIHSYDVEKVIKYMNM